MEPNHISDVFFSLENPAIYALVFTLVILVVVFLIKKEFIQPLTKNKRKLELENAKLAALYSEIDPDPIIRVDYDWNLMDLNNSAKNIFNDKKVSLENLVSQIKGNDGYLNNSFTAKLGERSYSINIKDVKDLSFFHIYLHDITSRIEYEEKIKNYKDNLRELRIKIDNVNEEEKRKIGKELHDSIGHSLSLLKIGIQNFLDLKKISADEEEVNEILDPIDDLSNEVRELSHELRPRILDEFGLVSAIKSLVDKINLQGINHGYVSQNKNIILNEKTLELNIYRICQEALHNILKHSNCEEFYIDFYIDKKFLSVTVADNGRGFDMEKHFNNEKSSLGILNMKERAESVAGSFKIDSMESMGTTISMKFQILEVNHD